MTDQAVHRPHPKPKDYWLIAFILSVITAVEVAIAYTSIARVIVVTSLIVLSVAKFVIVAGWFMHLRFDRTIYTRFFLVGIVGAMALFAVVLLSFGLLIGS